MSLGNGDVKKEAIFIISACGILYYFLLILLIFMSVFNI